MTRQPDGGMDSVDVRTAFESRYGGLVAHLARSMPAEILLEALTARDPFDGLAASLAAARALGLRDPAGAP
ncbi:MAG: hypothetical protein ACOCVZ_00995 [Gemmatimonadota bacterium]